MVHTLVKLCTKTYLKKLSYFIPTNCNKRLKSCTTIRKQTVLSKIPTEQQLIRKCIKGDRSAQYTLYQQYKVYLFSVTQRYGKTREEAEDILQEGFYRIFKDLHQYQGNGPFRAWMRKVMVNTALMHIRKHHKVIYTELNAEVNDHQNNADTSLLNSDRSKAIIKLIQKLPVTQQLVFNMKAIDGYSFNEISSKIGTNEATLRSHYLRARTKLQTLLKQEIEKNG